MFRTFRRHSPRGFASSLALALSLAGGAAVSTALIAPAAYAEDYSKGFVAAYQPVSELVNGEGADLEAAKARLPGVVSAIETDDDRNAAGSLHLTLGQKLDDRSLQRRGLELMVASGKTPPEQLGRFNFFIGNLAFEDGDFAAARAALEAAMAAGYTENDPGGLILESYLQEDNPAGGIAYALKTAADRKAAGGKIPEQWLLRSLQAAYNSGLVAQSADLSAVLVAEYPTKNSWINGLQVIGALGDFDKGAELDLLRLMRKTGAMTDVNEYQRYIENADPRIMSNEVVDVLAEGLAAGVFNASDSYYVDVKSVVDARMAQDRRDADATARDADTGTGRDAMAAGDLYYSLKNFADAETYYAMALEKGGVDRDTALTRLGIAQVQQGKAAEAQETFGQVGGARAPIATVWAAYAASEAS